MALVVLAAPLATWGTLPLGDDRPDLNRNIEPPALLVDAKQPIALFAWALILLAGGLLLTPAGRRATSPQDVRVVWPLLVSAVLVAATYSAMVQPVTGANIGAGVMFLLACVVVPALALLALWRVWRLRRR